MANNNIDPFSGLLLAIREEVLSLIQPSYHIGKIKSELPNLIVELGDMPLYKQQLEIDKTLLDRHNFSVSCSQGSVTHNLNDKLSVGDKVIMLKNGDKFIIISKVVSI